MNKKFIFIFFLIWLFSFDANSQSYIIKFKNDKSAVDFIQSSGYGISKLFPSNITKITDRLQNFNRFNPNLYFKLNTNNQQIVLLLSKDDRIEFIEPNHKYKLNQIKYNDSLYTRQWSLELVNAKTTMTKLTGKGVKIAVVDSGIDYYHPELKNQFLINSFEDLNQNGTFEPWDYREIRNGISGDLNGIDEDGNGFADDVIGYDFVDLETTYFGDWHNPDPVPDDEAGHGTNVASIIAAEGNNNVGIVGLASNSKILNVRAFDITGNGETDDIALAIIYSAIRSVDIINMSFGDYFNSRLLEDAINFAVSMGCILVASAGNDDKPDPHYPSDFKDVICVGSSKKDGTRSGFSNWGVNLSLLAPGEEILTCESGGGYNLSNGTSFSAPFVSAAIALYLETNPKPTACEMRSHLEATARRLSPQGWSFKLGAGLLDVANFLSFEGLSNIEINSFDNYTALLPNSSIELSINAITPLFKSAQIEISEQNSPNFIPITNEFNQQFKAEKISLDLSKIKNNAVISLKLILYNGQILRRNRAVRMLLGKDSIKVFDAQVTPAIQNGKRVIIFSALTNIETDLTINYRHQDFPSIVFSKIDLWHKDRQHMIFIDNLTIPGRYQLEAVFSPITNNQLDTTKVVKYLDFDFNFQLFPTQNVIQKSYKLPRAYLNNNVLDLFNKGTGQIVINDLSNFVIENAKIYEFQNNSFRLLDTLKDWIPVAFGDVNGNGLTDILMTYNGRTQITEAKSKGQTPFGSVIYQSNFSLVEWGENLFDIDGDGLDEMIGYNDSSYFALKFNKSLNKFNVLARTKLPENLKNKGLTKSSVIADIDGDGKPELVHSNYYGHLFVYEFDKNTNQFILEFVDSTNYGYSNPILTLLKNADNTKEIIIATYGSENLFGESNANDIIWNIRSLKHNPPNKYTIKNIENITGVRAGIDPRLRIGFRNGILAADYDKDGADELIISTMPNTYILKKVNGQWQPYWHYPYSFTNSALIWDFDKNGINEIGIATFDSTKFFELPGFSKTIATPQFYDAYTLNDNIVVMKWTKIPNAHFYRIYKLIQSDIGELLLQQISKTELDSLVVINLEPNKYHYFIVTSVDTTNGINESNYSEILKIFAKSPIQPIKVKTINNRTLIVGFNGKIKPTINSNDVFLIHHLNNNYEVNPISIIANSDSSYILTLPRSLEKGEHEMICNSFRDYWNNPSLPSSIFFEIADPNEVKEIYLKSLFVRDLNRIEIEFSDFLDTTTANNPINYEIKPIGKIISAKADETNLSKVVLQLNDDIKNSNITGQIYSITAKNIKSRDGIHITSGSGNTLSFVLVKDNIKSVFTFPNPVSISKDEFLGFGNLPHNFRITIMTLQGAILKTISDNNAIGAIRWNLTDESGNKLNIGTYLYKISGMNENGEETDFELNKFAIVP